MLKVNITSCLTADSSLTGETFLICLFDEDNDQFSCSFDLISICNPDVSLQQVNLMVQLDLGISSTCSVEQMNELHLKLCDIWSK